MATSPGETGELPTPRRGTHWAVWVGLGILVIMLISSLQDQGLGSRAATPRTQCRNNLKQIGLALRNYHEVWGSFPPAIMRDTDGKRTHSWPVLILPYVQQTALYNAYRFDEPWNGPNNRKLAELGNEVYVCPADHTGKPGTATNYVAIVGDSTVWPGSEAIHINDISDGLENTILVAEVANSGIHWMEPRDLDVQQMAPVINPKAGQGISSKHRTGANVCFADGNIEFLSESIAPESLHALLTARGGEKIRRIPGPNNSSDVKLLGARKSAS